MQNIFDAELLRRSPARVKRVQRWIRALKSGKTYKRGKSFLRIAGPKRSEDQFCCLGVMLDLDQPKGWVDLEEVRRGDSGMDVSHQWGLPGNSSELPNDEACRRYGLFSTADSSQGGSSKLAYLNDHGRSFKQIAQTLATSLNEALKR